MAQPAEKRAFEVMDGPRKKKYQPWEQGDSIAITLDPDVLQEHGIDAENLPVLEEWIFEDEGKIIIDLPEAGES